MQSFPTHTSLGQVVDDCRTLSKRYYGIGYAYDGEHHFGSYNNMNKQFLMETGVLLLLLS